MSDLQLRLLHCEKEPSQVALYDAADAYLAVGDEEMYYALKYMADNMKYPWKSINADRCWHWPLSTMYPVPSSPGFDDILPSVVVDSQLNDLKTYHSEYTFADAVRWLGKRLIELGMVQS